MFNRTSGFFYRNATGRNVLIFVILQMLISAVVLPRLQDSFDPERTKGLMDLSVGFTPDRGYEIIDSYGAEGRKSYLLGEIIIDVIYPIIYSIAFTLLVSFIFKKAFSPGQWIYKLNFLPLFCALFDFIENAGIVRMLTVFPARADLAAQLASGAGLMKWTFTGITILLFLTGLIAWAIKGIRK
ncbi:hypothetical protein GVN16_02835 [Emticicia sp. CRIBPO]|uniref:hypothetical protein n=1 Tax=Emticicia sp. CRIBPO TaxID=2683258 RepID=UPI0014133AD6|nr:hypothetical protein [Emticicia sp. CRIBPO]NBA84676.1 hypothetical protein [Emticicia sp. CRIBPO]